MNELTFKYPGRKTISMSIASTWNDLTQKQLFFIAKNWELWKVMSKSNISLLKEKCKIFINLVPEGYKTEIRKAVLHISDEQLFELSELTNFIFENNNLTKCPVPTIKHESEILHAPSDRMGNIVAMEFATADHYYMQYHENPDDDALTKLIATLYRPLNIDGFERIDFNKNNDVKYFKAAASIDETLRQSILLWYIGCRSHIIKNNSDVFSKDNESTAKASGWLPVILAMSGNKFGTFDQTALTDFHLILMELREMKNRLPKK
jgi:hypothetical protein